MKIEFDTENAAFDPDDGLLEPEVARILRDIANQVERACTAGTIRDINGNTIGRWEL